MCDSSSLRNGNLTHRKYSKKKRKRNERWRGVWRCGSWVARRRHSICDMVNFDHLARNIVFVSFVRILFTAINCEIPHTPFHFIFFTIWMFSFHFFAHHVCVWMGSGSGIAGSGHGTRHTPDKFQHITMTESIYNNLMRNENEWNERTEKLKFDRLRAQQWTSVASSLPWKHSNGSAWKMFFLLL